MQTQFQYIIDQAKNKYEFSNKKTNWKANRSKKRLYRNTR